MHPGQYPFYHMRYPINIPKEGEKGNYFSGENRGRQGEKEEKGR